jgi:hypothetical protein
MKLRQLRRTHAEYDRATLDLHGDLFAGGAQFHRNVSKYLPQGDVEPHAVYKKRCAVAHYVGYVAPIVNFFASWLFTCPLTFKADDDASIDQVAQDFYSEFKEDADGLGTDLDTFLRDRFVQAAKDRCTYWRVEVPEQPTAEMHRAEWESTGLGRATIVPVNASALTNWKRDDRGAWEWVVEYSREESLREFTDDECKITETWTLWSADGEHRRWRAEYSKSKPPTEAQEIAEIPAPPTLVPGIPLVELSLPPDLWIVNLLASGQLEHFRKMAALSWSIDRTCYAMPFFFVKNKKSPPVMGRGYYGIMGLDEKVEWPTPPAAPFATVQDYAARLKDELHRITHQMQAAVDNTAAATTRSAESKQEDGRATEIVLSAFGSRVREAVERTFMLIAATRDDDVEWSVGGMDDYQLPDAKGLAESALATDPLRIPSVTFRRELLTRVALAQLPDVDEETRTKIRNEIKAGVNAEDMYPDPVTPPGAGPLPGDGDPLTETDPKKSPPSEE